MPENSLLIEDIVGSKAFDQLEALELNLDAVNAQVEGLVKTFNTLGKAVEEANDIRKLANVQQQLNKAQGEAVNLSKKQAAAQDALNNKVKESAQQEQDLQKALAKTASSIKEAREQNKLLTAARNATNVSTKEGVEQLNRLNAKIDQNNAFIKANGDAALKQKLNIGNYASALDGLGGKFGGVVKQGQGMLNMFKSLMATPVGIWFATVAAAAGAATAAFRLWITTTASGEEVAHRFRTQLDLIKDNLKNNAGFRMANADLYNYKEGVEDVTEAEERAILQAAALGGTMAMAAAQADASARKASAAAAKSGDAVAKASALFQKLLKDQTGYESRSEEYAQKTYDLMRNEIDQSERLAELTREIALLKEKASDPSTAPDKAIQAAVRAQELLNEKERIEVGFAQQKVDLVAEQTKLTNTSRFTALQAFDAVQQQYQAEKDGLEAIINGQGAAKDLTGKRLALSDDLVSAELRLADARRQVNNPSATAEELAAAEENLAAQEALTESLREQISVLDSLGAGTLTVEQAKERLAVVDRELASLSERRTQIARGTIEELQAEREANTSLLNVQSQYADQRRGLSRLIKRLQGQDVADRKAALKDYTDTLKQELANQVAAAKAAADEAKAVYDAKGNEGLNQLDDVRAWIDARNAALDAEQQAEEELVRKSAEKEVELLQLTGEEAARVTEKMEADLLAIQEKYAIKRESLSNDNARQAASAVAGQIQAEQAKITADIQSELDARQVDLSQALEEGKITYRQYHKAIEQDQREALRKRLKAQIEYYEKIMQAEGVSVEEQRKALSELARLYDQFGKEMNEGDSNPNAYWDNLDWDGKAGAILDKTREVWDAVNQVVSQSIQNQIQEIDNRQKRLDKNYEKQKDQVKSMGLSQRQEELETARIEREHEAETEKLEAEKAALQVKQAKWNKVNSIVQATISGALAIVQAFAQAGPVAGAVFAGIIAATTAAQIAMIAAQKIPEYREGREGGPAELAIVGDGGVPEVIRTRSGKAFITPAEPTLTRLGAGDKVFRNVEEYLLGRDGGGDLAAGELRRLRKENREDNEMIQQAMMHMNAKLSVTSAGLAWLRGGKGGYYGRG